MLNTNDKLQEIERLKQEVETENKAICERLFDKGWRLFVKSDGEFAIAFVFNDTVYVYDIYQFYYSCKGEDIWDTADYDINKFLKRLNDKEYQVASKSDIKLFDKELDELCQSNIEEIEDTKKKVLESLGLC